MAKKITIHPLYVYQNRTQNDIALIETEKAFDFTQLDKIAPICLPSILVLNFVKYIMKLFCSS